MKNSSINELFSGIPKIFSSKNKPQKQLSDSVIDQKTDIERTTGTYKCESDEFNVTKNQNNTG